MKTHRTPFIGSRAALPAFALLIASLLCPSAVFAQAAPAPSRATAAPPPAAAPTDKDIVELSPFTVTSDKDKGYWAENTISGSRLNTPLSDIAASITVVTKQQMEDTASIDINDVFKYEASTEGSSTYTPSITDRNTFKDQNAGYSFGNDGTLSTNATANRIRGLNAPDAAINNFSTNNRIPFDGYNTQSVEISRGPNSLLFGLGTPSGVVNQNTAVAALNRDTNSVSLRMDQNGSYRSAFTVNRSIIQDKLAVYGAFLYDNRQFERKPSRDLYRRQYGAVTYKPFKNTLIRAFVENFRNDANRPNTITPRDNVTPWIQAGRPVYDPLTRSITVLDTNRVYGPYVSSTLSPGYNAAVNTLIGTAGLTTTTSPLFVPGITFDDVTRNIRLIDNGAVVNFMQRQFQFYAPAQTNPATATPTVASLGWTANDPRFLFVDRYWTASTTLPQPTTSINGRTYTYGSWNFPGINNKSIYNWTKYNTLQTNFGQSRASNYNLTFEQQLLPNLFFSGGWLRQDMEEADNYTINQLQGATLGVDTNKNLIDGKPNPYFGIPFLYEGVGGGLDTFYLPETDDNYRAMLAYTFDATKNHNWTRWLGHHRLLGMWQEQDVIKATERWRMVFTGGDPDAVLRYTSNLSLPAQAQWNSYAMMRHYYMGSPGGPQGVVTHSLGFYGNQGWNTPFTSPIEVWNYQTQQYQNENLTEQTLFGTGFRTQREVKGTQFALQSYLWEDRLIGTFGWRDDKYRARITTTGPITDTTGKTVAPSMTNDQLYLLNQTGVQNHDAIMNRWNHWDKLSGATKTLSGAFRPLQGLDFVKRLGGGESSFISQFLQSVTFYANTSDNFNPPATFQTDYFLQSLPKPTGKTKETGIGFNIFGNKLVARINWFETSNLNERTGAAGTLLTRSAYSDTTTGIPWASTVQRIRNGLAAGRTLADIVSVNNWNSNTVNDISGVADQQKIWDMLKLPVNYYSGLSPGATQNSKSKGTEIQLTYNPTPGWTMKLTGSKNQATYTDVAPQYDQWVNYRMPVWTTMAATDIPDFTDGAGRRYSLRNFWTGYGFTNVAQIENTDGNTSPQAYFNNVVVSQVALAKALEGAVSPLQRIYHASFLTNYSFSREAFDGRLKGFSVGGSVRWESKAAIGFYGKVGDPVNSPTVINLNDITKPIYDKGNYYSDVWVSYSRKIYHEKVGMKIQLNCNNWAESGRLMPTAVNFDGTPWAYRIIDPRQWILQASFTF